MFHFEECTGFKYKVTSAYHLQSNGLDECFNQTLKSCLQHLVNDHHNNWDELVDEVLFAYRTSQQASTKCTPFFLMHSREARLPIGVKISIEGNTDTSSLSVGDKVKRLVEMQEKAHLTALENIVKSTAKAERTI